MREAVDVNLSLALTYMEGKGIHLKILFCMSTADPQISTYGEHAIIKIISLATQLIFQTHHAVISRIISPPLHITDPKENVVTK